MKQAGNRHPSTFALCESDTSEDGPATFKVAVEHPLSTDSRRLLDEFLECRGSNHRRMLFFPLEKVAVARNDALGAMATGQRYQVIIIRVAGQRSDHVGVGYDIRGSPDRLDVERGGRAFDPTTHSRTFHEDFPNLGQQAWTDHQLEGAALQPCLDDAMSRSGSDGRGNEDVGIDDDFHRSNALNRHRGGFEVRAPPPLRTRPPRPPPIPDSPQRCWR